MPVHKVRKRYVLFSWEKDTALPTRHQLDQFLQEINNPDERGAVNQVTRLIILDSRISMGIIKTTHTLVSRLKTHLTERTDGSNMPKFKVVAVSGTIKKLKLKLVNRSTFA